MSPSPISVVAPVVRRRWWASAVVAPAVVAIVALAGCSTTTTGGAARSLVVLTADQATEVLVPAGAFDQPVATTVPTSAATETSAPSTASSADATATDDGTAVTVEATAAPSATEPADQDPAGATTAAPTTSTTPPTTTVEAVKETIPLAEEDVHPGVKLMGALDDFNRCLDGEGHEWIGFPNAELGPDDPVNQPGYLQALQLCNSRTQISKVYQEYQTSRADLTPDEIREENEGFIDLADCLRGRGWSIGELRPDESGLLNPGDQFAGPDGDIVTDDIRDCVGEIALARGED